MFSAGGSTRIVLPRARVHRRGWPPSTAVIQKAVAPRTRAVHDRARGAQRQPVRRVREPQSFRGVAADGGGAGRAATSIARMRDSSGFAAALARIDRAVHELRRVFTAIAAIVHVGVLLLTLSRSALAGLGVRRARRLAARTAAHAASSAPACRRCSAWPAPALLMLVLFVDVDRLGDAPRARASTPTTGAPAAPTIWRESLPIIAGLLADRHRRGHLSRTR